MKNDNDVLYYFRNIIKKMHNAADRKLIPLGITHWEMRILLAVYNSKNPSQDEIAASIPIDRSNVGRALKKLENLGYIKRVKSQKDARAKEVLLTEKGEESRDKVLEIKTHIRKAFASFISEDESKVLKEILKKIDKGLNQSANGAQTSQSA